MIYVIGTVGVPACYGGFETLVENLISNNDNQFVIYCSAETYKKKIKIYKGANLIYIPFKANGIQSIFYDLLSFIHSFFHGRGPILVLGVSGAIAIPIVKLFQPNRRIITNIDGLEWRRDKWGKIAKWFLKFSEKIAVIYSDKIISDNQGIADYVSLEYGVVSDVIAYGGDHAYIENTYPENGFFDDYDLSICRIEPENNVELILISYSKMHRNIKFIGNWSSSSFGIKLKEKYSIYKNIDIIEANYDLSELGKLRRGCYNYIHGHSAGGTNPSLVEMMHYGKNIIAYDCIYNRYTTENKSLYFSSSLELCELIKSYNNEFSNGLAMKEIASRRYTWDVIRKEYINVILNK